MHIADESLRDALALELSDLLYRQRALALCNEHMSAWDEHFRRMAEEDHRTLDLLEAVTTAFGLHATPRRSTEQIADLLIDTVAGETAQPLEKLNAYMLLKKTQQTAVHFVRKVSQSSLPDIRMTLEPLDGMQSHLNNHMSQLMNFMDGTGVAWLTGREASEGLLSRATEMVSDLAGRMFNRQGGVSDEREIFSILQTDHRKMELLFKEIEDSRNHERALGIFRQLKSDLNAHSIAEEETVYIRFQGVDSMREYISEARQDHADIRVLLDEINTVLDEHEPFLDKLDELHQLVTQHLEDEENLLFRLIRKNSSDELRRDLAQHFLKARQRIQENIGTEEVSPPPSSQEPTASL